MAQLDISPQNSERLELPPGSSRIFWYVLVATAMAFFNRAMPTPFLPLVLVQEFGLPMVEVGLVLAAYPVGALVATSWSCGIARSSRGIVRLHSLAILVMAGAALLFPVVAELIRKGSATSGALAIAALRAAQGVSQALFLAANTSLITRCFREAVPYVVGMSEVAVGLGAQLGRLSGGPLYDAGGFGCPFLVTAVLQVACGCLGFAFKESTPFMQTAGGETASSTRHDLPWSMLMTPRVSVALSAVFGTYFMTGLYDATLPQHLEVYLGPLSVSAVSMISSTRSIAYLVSSYCCAQLLQRGLVSLESLITVGFTCVTIGLLTAAPQSALPTLAPYIFDSVSGRWIVMILSILTSSGGTAMLFVPSLPLMQREVAPLGRHAQEQVAMLFMSGMSVGEATGPILGGWLVGAYGFELTTGVCALLISGVLAVALLVFGTRHRVADRRSEATDLDSALLKSGARPPERRALCVPIDGESAYSYRRIPFALSEARMVPGSAPSATFRKAYSNRAVVPEPSTVPATSWRRSYKPGLGRPGSKLALGTRDPPSPNSNSGSSDGGPKV